MALSCNKEQAQNNDTPADEGERPIPATLDLHAGDTYPFVPKVEAGIPCYWSSKDEAVATIDENGVVTAKGNGTATIVLAVIDGGILKSWECVVHVSTPVTGISLDITSKDLTMGQSFTLTATVEPPTASNKKLVWTSSSPDLVSISVRQGVCTVNAMGGISNAKITVKTEDGSFSDKCTVNVKGASRPYEASKETSNCYVIFQPGTYILDLVQGNSSDPVTGVKKADVLWETFGTDEDITAGTLVTDYFYSECLNKIIFTIPSPIKSGNALIAAKSASGTTLWSWHLWICNGYRPDQYTQTYKDGTVMMDRNLGATGKTGTKGEDHGLLYQWGRKDPFPGFSTGSNEVKVTYPAGPMRTGANRNLDYSIAWPKEFICGGVDSDFDWLASSNRTLWTSAKTKYDPCPPGWRVPTGGANGVWKQSAGESDFYVSCDTEANLKGKFVSGLTDIYYPLTRGFFYDYKPTTDTYYWSCTYAEDHESYCLWIQRNISGDVNNIHTLKTVSRAYGCAVRCCKK